MSRTRAPRTIALFALLALLITACADAEDGVIVSGLDPQGAANHIVAILAGTGEHTALLAALEATGLEAELRGGGRFTLFAPTDAAFEALPPGLLDALLDPANQDLLGQILAHHVSAEVLLEADLVARGRAPTLEGSSVLVGAVEEPATEEGAAPTTRLMAGAAELTSTDQWASNGAIHVVDAVMIPFTLTEQVEGLIESLPAFGDIVTMLEDMGRFDSLLEALQEAGLTSLLRGEGPLTLFAPTDAAFDALSALQLEALAERDVLDAVLRFHLAGREVRAADIAVRLYVRTLEGAGVLVERSAGTASVGGIELSEADIVATNGVIHVIDALLLPDGIATIGR